MEEQFFAAGFQFEKYINERLLEVTDEGERRALKEVMKETLIPFYRHTENAYIELEKRLAETQNSQKGKCEIITGIEHRNKIDITEEALVPMKYEDLNETVIDIYDMKEHLERGEAYTVMKVFIQLHYAELRRWEREKRKFRAIILTNDGEYFAEVQLKKNQSYIKQITDLYQVFENNGLEWNTVCAPYLAKFFDVQLVSTDCPLDSEIIKLTIDFQEYQEKVVYDMVPMWNVRMMKEKTGAYPDFALDKIHYEHCIYRGRFVTDRDYLVDSNECKLWNVFRQDGDLHIVCDVANPTSWKLVEFGYDSLKKKYDMPIFRNHKSDMDENRCIHTRAEIKRYISKLGYESYLELSDVDIIEGWKEQFGTYSIDEFIEDEIRVNNMGKHLVFKFRPIDKGYFLNQDIMSYLVSKIQWQLPEFKCVGELE